MILSSRNMLVLFFFVLALCSQQVNAAFFELHAAVRNNDVEGLRAMLKFKNVRDVINIQEQVTGWTPLHVAAILGRISCGKILLDSGARPHVPDFFGRTPLAYALAINNTQKSGFLISRLLEARWNR